ncbi:MAG: NADH-quinone oxidoreductase subunit J [Deltaproteobacteria bacterium]|nr:MAG: NADH-quinone oxidoreductase subunit J [Deltaproteobacteria bacterium]
MGGITGLLMALAVAGGLLAVSLKNVLHAIFGLALTLLAVAGLFAVLGSPFVATMQVLIYVGGITVAMVFAVMLSTVVQKHATESPWRRAGAAVVALGFAVGVGMVIAAAGLPDGPAPELVADAWTVRQIGTSLLGDYNVVFEVLSVVLLLAIIGAIVISRHEGEEKQS